MTKLIIITIAIIALGINTGTYCVNLDSGEPIISMTVLMYGMIIYIINKLTNRKPNTKRIA